MLFATEKICFVKKTLPKPHYLQTIYKGISFLSRVLALQKLGLKLIPSFFKLKQNVITIITKGIRQIQRKVISKYNFLHVNYLSYFKAENDPMNYYLT